MKTPEEMAEEWSNNRCPEQGPEFIVWCMCKEDFLAGYKAGCVNTQMQLAVGEKTIRDLLGKSQWISVKDRLPQLEYGFAMRRESECVLIASDGNVHVAHLCEKWCDRTQLIFEACDCDCRGYDMEQDEWELDDVTHWQPLPEAPKEEK